MPHLPRGAAPDPTATPSDAAPAPALPGVVPPTFAEALRFWLVLGFISFGGPAGQIALMHSELVERRRWISEWRYLHALNYCMVLPGPEAQQLATYVGWLLHGTRGGIAAGALFVLPSLLLLIGLSWLYMAYGHTPAVAGVLWAIKPAVTAIVVAAAWRIGRRVLKNAALWAIAAGAFVAIALLGLPFPLIIVGAALVGAAGGHWAPQRFGAAPAHTAGVVGGAAAVIGDGMPPPPHARFTRRRLAAQLVVGAGLWLLPIALLAWAFGPQGLYTTMGLYFTKAALLTFGGAYAVLPYVAQAAVAQYGWLSALQMIDGLALGETTPGPLIIVVAFVGFVGGWTHAPWGAEHVLAAAAFAACVATWFTFLPSFLFILIGGPLIEATHGALRLTAPLTAITAAVVGVIANLALYFAQHVLWPQGWGGGFDTLSLAIGVVAALALMRFQVSVVRVIAVCALLGLLRAAVASAA